MIDLERVATFIAVVKCGGFREAAKQTGLSQPTVTQHIKRLEQSLQARLIDRATMPQSLTLEGKIFFPYAEQLLRTSHKATAALHNKSLVVGASSNIGIYLLQPYIKALQDKLGITGTDWIWGNSSHWWTDDSVDQLKRRALRSRLIKDITLL